MTELWSLSTSEVDLEKKVVPPYLYCIDVNSEANKKEAEPSPLEHKNILKSFHGTKYFYEKLGIKKNDLFEKKFMIQLVLLQPELKETLNMIQIYR